MSSCDKNDRDLNENLMNFTIFFLFFFKEVVYEIQSNLIRKPSVMKINVNVDELSHFLST